MIRKTLPSFLSFFVIAVAAQALQFTSSGPTGPLSFRPATAVIVPASSPQIVYALVEGTLYGSTDAGATWMARSTPNLRIDHIAVDPSSPAIVYSASAIYAYRSDDGGATWTRLKNGLPPSGFLPNAIRIDPQTPSTVYIGAQCVNPLSPFGAGVYKSVDRGQSWSKLQSRCLRSLAIDPATPDRLYFDTTDGAKWRTSDGGAQWQLSLDPLPVVDVVADPVDPLRRYGLGNSAVMVSNDEGASWVTIAAEGLPSGVADLAIGPKTGRLFASARSGGLFFSDDGGAHWARVASVPRSAASLAVAGDDFYVATTYGVDRLSLEALDKPTRMEIGEQAPVRLSVFRVALDPQHAQTLFATVFESAGFTTFRRVYRSTDGGRHWELITNEDDLELRYAIAVDAAGDLYGADRGTIWRFAKATQSWERFDAPEVKHVPIALFANPMLAGRLYAIGYYFAAYSVDGGRTWSPMIGVNGLVTMSIAPNGNDLYGGNNSGTYASSDGGVTWRALTSGESTHAIAVAPSRPATIYRLSYLHNEIPALTAALSRSDDGGVTWTRIRWPKEAWTSGALVVDPRDHRSVWIGLDHSLDGGVTWTTEPSNVPLIGTKMAIDRDGLTMFAIDEVQRMWRATLRAPRRRAVGR